MGKTDSHPRDAQSAVEPHVPNLEKRVPQERNSTDESLRVERSKTDSELARRADVAQLEATSILTEAREKADAVLNDARDLEDLKGTRRSDGDVRHERAREDAELEGARSTADAVARDDRSRRNIALASLLAFERDGTDLRLETERDRIDAALSSREDIMAMVSHDLRSLLGGIALCAELLKLSPTNDTSGTTVQKYAGQIQGFTARMNRLVGDLMDVATIEAGKLTLHRTHRNPALLLRDAMDAFEPAATSMGITLTSESTLAPCASELDHERMLQVLTNLVGNALKFTKRDGRISLKLERHGSDVRFAVADSGSGISPDVIGKVFDRYYQSSPGDRRGLGLGLFIATSIVEGHGGKLWVESESGKGSTFFFTLPISPAANAVTASADVSNSPSA
jgi:signal transduction histidine kinase